MRSAVFDACVLYPAPLRDLLLRLTKAGVVDGFWSSAILNECFRSVARNRPDLPAEVLEASRAAMETYFPSRLVSGHEALIEELSLPDPDDRHVLAATIHAGLPTIVTFNLKDFPANELARHHVVAVHPDEFVLAAIGRDTDAVLDVVEEQRASLRRPPATMEQLLDRLAEQGLRASIEAIRRHLESRMPLR